MRTGKLLKKIAMIGAIFCAFNMYAENGGVKSETPIFGEVFPVDYQKGTYYINENFPRHIVTAEDPKRIEDGVLVRGILRRRHGYINPAVAILIPSGKGI